MVAKSKFIRRADCWCWCQYHVHVTARLVADWVERKLAPPPIRKGLGRGRGSRSEWDALAYRAVCKLARWQSKGLTSTDSLRILLWISGQYFEPKTLRRSCVREMERLNKSKKLSTRSLADPSHDKLENRSRKAIARSVGQVDPRLVPEGFKYSESDRIGMISDLREGTVKGNYAVSLVSVLNQRGHFPVEVGAAIASLFSGFLSDGNSTESSGVQSLKSAEIAHFKRARSFLRDNETYALGFAASATDNQDPKEILAQNRQALDQAEFRILIFLLLVHGAYTGNLEPSGNASTAIVPAMPGDFLDKARAYFVSKGFKPK